MIAPVAAVVVVIPAHDEADLIAECIASVVAAARRLDVPVSIDLVADGCRDDSAALARAAGATVHEVDARSVGAARAHGVARALARLPDVPLEQIWTAHTDADSVVPAHWLSDQVAAADAGADVYIGTVRPDFRDLDRARIAAWHATHVPGAANGHVHGANLGMRASILHAAGGFAPVPEHEDVLLVARARELGARALASDAAWVRTSGRIRGRTPGGYARYLRDDLLGVAAGVD